VPVRHEQNFRSLGDTQRARDNLINQGCFASSRHCSMAFHMLEDMQLSAR
jgi:hypothetical protein